MYSQASDLTLEEAERFIEEEMTLEEADCFMLERQSMFEEETDRFIFEQRYRRENGLWGPMDFNSRKEIDEWWEDFQDAKKGIPNAMVPVDEIIKNDE